MNTNGPNHQNRSALTNYLTQPCPQRAEYRSCYGKKFGHQRTHTSTISILPSRISHLQKPSAPSSLNSIIPPPSLASPFPSLPDLNPNLNPYPTTPPPPPVPHQPSIPSHHTIPPSHTQTKHKRLLITSQQTNTLLPYLTLSQSPSITSNPSTNPYLSQTHIHIHNPSSSYLPQSVK